MSSQPEYKLYTPEEYLELERKAEIKSEYVNGEMLAMAGASRQHVLIVTNIVSELRTQMKGRQCNVYSTDMRVKVDPTGMYAYPDVAAVCGEDQFEDSHGDTLLNPQVIIEVLSESTESYDRGEKFAHYRRLDSLREYLLVSQNRRLMEHYIRQPNNRWLFSEHCYADDVVELPSIECILAVAEVYDKVMLSRNTGKV